VRPQIQPITTSPVTPCRLSWSLQLGGTTGGELGKGPDRRRNVEGRVMIRVTYSDTIPNVANWAPPVNDAEVADIEQPVRRRGQDGARQRNTGFVQR
jgi:hypothetical protein